MKGFHAAIADRTIHETSHTYRNASLSSKIVGGRDCSQSHVNLRIAVERQGEIPYPVNVIRSHFAAMVHIAQGAHRGAIR